MRDRALASAAPADSWWASWASVTERPGSEITYTANWPHAELVGNTPASNLLIWPVFSVLFLIAGIGLLGWHYATSHGEEMVPVLPKKDPLAAIKVTPSMRATAKYFWVVIALFLVQILLGATTAHYQVEGQEAYGFALAEILPYSLTRTWHTQLAVLWIATAWLGMGLYIAPAISGHEPKVQRLGGNFRWVGLIVIVVGSFAGQWFAVMQKLGLATVRWLANDVSAFLCCTVVNLWLALPFMIMIMDGALQAVDHSCYGRAILDGANWCQRAYFITIPAIRPIIAPSVLITVFTTFKQFDVVYLLTQQAGAKTGANIHAPGTAKEGRNPLLTRALGNLHVVLQDQGNTDGADQRRQPCGVSQRFVSHAFDDPAIHASHHYGENQGAQHQ